MYNRCPPQACFRTTLQHLCLISESSFWDDLLRAPARGQATIIKGSSKRVGDNNRRFHIFSKRDFVHDQPFNAATQMRIHNETLREMWSFKAPFVCFYLVVIAKGCWSKDIFVSTTDIFPMTMFIFTVADGGCRVTSKHVWDNASTCCYLATISKKCCSKGIFAL